MKCSGCNRRFEATKAYQVCPFCGKDNRGKGKVPLAANIAAMNQKV